MIRPQFSAYLDDAGNVHIADGSLIDSSSATTAILWMGGSAGQIALPDDDYGLRRAVGNGGTFSMGGSGTNVEVTGTIAGLVIGSGSGAYTVKPTGIFSPSDVNEWSIGDFTMTFDPGAGTAEISDDTDVIATMASSGSGDAPDGTFSSTTYGETTYNASSAFTLTAVFEDRLAWVGATVTAGISTTIEEGSYTGTGFGAWESDSDPNWTITTATDGSAVLNDGTDDVATRATGAHGDPSGIYQATPYGIVTYSSASSFSIDVRRVPVRAPMTGVWYCTVETSGGSGSGPGGGHTVDDFTGPHFAATLPANSSSETHFPICQSNGSAFWQVIEGAILWH